MSKSRLLQVSEAAELIEKVTGEPRFEVAKKINHAGQFDGLRFFNKAGRPVSWMPGVYSVVEDDEGRRELVGNRFFRVDIGELIAAFGYHDETGAAILAAAGLSADADETKEERRKKAALIKDVLSFWPTIETDLNDANRNGLDVANLPEHGWWSVLPALQWASERGKLSKSASSSYVKQNEESALSPMLRLLLKID